MKRILESERIYLRGFVGSDYQDLHEYLSLHEVVKFEPYGVLSLEECKKEARNRSNNPCYYAIILKDTSKLIGNIFFCQKQPFKFLTYEIGYVLNPKYWNMGYATEAAQLMLRYGFDILKAHRIVANCHPDNERSYLLMERIGMRREMVSKKNVFFNTNANGVPEWLDSYMYAILEEEYFASQKYND